MSDREIMNAKRGISREVTTKQIYIDGVNEYDYKTYKKHGCIIHKLYRSGLSEWANPGELIVKITDDGNGIHLSNEIGNQMDYATSLEIGILLKIISLNDCKSIEWASIGEKESI